MASDLPPLPHRALTDTGNNLKLKTFCTLQGVNLVICSLIPDCINEAHLEAAGLHLGQSVFFSYNIPFVY